MFLLLGQEGVEMRFRLRSFFLGGGGGRGGGRGLIRMHHGMPEIEMNELRISTRRIQTDLFRMPVALLR